MPQMEPEQFDLLKQDIKAHGVIVPIERDADTGEIIDGHHRFRAFKELIEEGADLPMFDVVTRKFASEDAKVEYVISLNVNRRHITPEQRVELIVKLRKPPFSYTMSKIASLLGVNVGTVSRDIDGLSITEREELKSAAVTATNGKIFSGGYAKRIYTTGERAIDYVKAGNLAAASQEIRTEKLDDAYEKYPVQPGELWWIPSEKTDGVHKLLCGNVLDGKTLPTLMDGDLARLVVTSPPYNLGHNATKTGRGSFLGGYASMGNQESGRLANAYQDDLPEQEYQKQQVALFTLLHQHTTPDASVMYNHTNRYQDKVCVSPLEWLRTTNWALRSEIIWDCGAKLGLNARMFIPADERIYWLYKTNGDFYFNNLPEITAWTTVWRITERVEERVSVPFPNEIPRRCILACSTPEDIILEPYCGSGTVLVEAERAERICYAVEINPQYCAFALARAAAAGLHPVKAPK